MRQTPAKWNQVPREYQFTRDSVRKYNRKFKPIDKRSLARLDKAIAKETK